MKKIVTMLSICFSLILLSNFAQAELPPKVPGENFQRVEKLIDCQQFWVPALNSAHQEIQRTTCFYKVIIDSDKHLMMYIETNNHNKKVVTGYLPLPEQK
jgi:hypothetical protein